MDRVPRFGDVIWFCKHDWRLVDKEVIEPPIYDMQKTIESFKAGPSSAKAMLRTTVIQIVSCTKCGRLKRMVTRSPAGKRMVTRSME